MRLIDETIEKIAAETIPYDVSNKHNGPIFWEKHKAKIDKYRNEFIEGMKAARTYYGDSLADKSAAVKTIPLPAILDICDGHKDFYQVRDGYSKDAVSFHNACLEFIALWAKSYKSPDRSLDNTTPLPAVWEMCQVCLGQGTIPNYLSNTTSAVIRCQHCKGAKSVLPTPLEASEDKGLADETMAIEFTEWFFAESKTHGFCHISENRYRWNYRTPYTIQEMFDYWKKIKRNRPPLRKKRIN